MGTSKSVSTVTKIVNGKSITTTTTTTRDSNGIVTEEIKEEINDGRGNKEVRYLKGGNESKNQKFIGNHKYWRNLINEN